MKKTALWYIGLFVFAASVILFAFPAKLGWDRNDIWLLGMPLSQLALLALPICSLVGLWIMYMGDRQAIKRRILKKRGETGEKEGKESC